MRMQRNTEMFGLLKTIHFEAFQEIFLKYYNSVMALNSLFGITNPYRFEISLQKHNLLIIQVVRF